jgi:4-amino-4-deoxy-L-arabinose transferase-like glycosyltransferase
LLLRLAARPSIATAIALGVALGLSLLAKQTSLVLLAIVAAVALTAFATRRRPLATMALLALGVGAAIGLPYFVRNWVLYGSPLYPMMARNVDRALWALHVKTFGMPAVEFYRTIFVSTWPGLALVYAAGLAWSLARRAWNLVTALLVTCLVLLALGPLMPVHDPRHMMPLVALMASLGAIATYAALARRRCAVALLEAVLLVAALIAVVRLPDYRSTFDADPILEDAFRAVRQYTPEGSMVLSLWTYDTAYYSERPATWPIPWGQRRHATGLFSERDPARFRVALDRYAIDYLLVPLGQVDPVFDGSNYTQSFVDCVHTLVDSGRLRVVWHSKYVALVGKPS